MNPFRWAVLVVTSIVFWRPCQAAPPATESQVDISGLSLLAAGDYSRAARALEEECHRRDVDSKRHDAASTARCLADLSKAYRLAGEFRAAQERGERGLQVLASAKLSDRPEAALVLTRLGEALLDLGAFPKASSRLSEALAIREKTGTLEEAEAIRLFIDLGLVHRFWSDPDAAQAWGERAVALAERRLGPTHPDTAEALENLAVLEEEEQRIVEAQLLMERVLRIRLGTLGPHHPDTALARGGLASLEAWQGRMKEARIEAEEALDILTATLGERHPQTAMAQGIVAQVELLDLGPARAEPLARSCVERLTARLGPDHPWVSLCLPILAQAVSRQRRPAEARAIMERALRIEEKSRGVGHSQHTQQILNLGMILQEQGNIAGARRQLESIAMAGDGMPRQARLVQALAVNALAGLSLAERDFLSAHCRAEEALSLLEELLGTENPFLANSLSVLAMSLIGLEQPDAAAEALDRGLHLRRKAYGSDNPLVAFSLLERARQRSTHGDPAGAEGDQREALAILERTVGPEHPYLINMLQQLASVRGMRGDPIEAARLQERAASIAENVLGAEDPLTGAALFGAGQAQSFLGETEQALQRLTRSLGILQRAFGPESVQVAAVSQALGHVQVLRGDLADARPLLERALAIQRRNFPSGDQQIAMTLESLGLLLQAEGRSIEAQKSLEEALSVAEKALGPQSSLGMGIIRDLALVLASRGDFAAARERADRALRTADATGPDNPQTRDLLRGFAWILWSHGEGDEAQNFLERALAIARSRFGDESSQAAQSLQDLGVLLAQRGDIAGSRILEEKALEVLRRLYGAEDPRVATALVALAATWISERQPAKARDLLEEALRLSEAGLPRNHPQITQILGGLALAQEAMGEVAAAAETYSRVVSLTEERRGLDHVEVAQALVLLGKSLYGQGRLAEARSHLERALRLEEQQLGREHAVTLDALMSLGNVLREQGDLVPAREFLEQALTTSRKLLGPSHAWVGFCLTSLSQVAQQQGDNQRAFTLAEEARQFWGKLLPANDPQQAVVLYNAATGRLGLGRPGEAQLLLDQALDIARRSFGADSAIVAGMYNHLAILKEQQGDWKGARELLENALEILGRSLPPDHPYLLPPTNNLANLLTLRGDLPAARERFSQVVRIMEKQYGPNDPRPGIVLQNQAMAEWMWGDRERAQQGFLRASERIDRAVTQIAPSLSFGEQVALVQPQLYFQRSCLLFSHRKGESLARAYSLFLGWKGILVELLRRQSRLAILAADSALQTDVEHWRELTANLAAFYHASRAEAAEESALIEEHEALERRLLKALPAAGQALGPVDLSTLRGALHDGEILVDIYRYFEVPETWQNSTERYAAIVIGPHAGPVYVDLGTAADVDGAVEAWRSNVLTRDVGVEESWSALEAKLWKPLIDAIPAGSARRIWVSPDSETARVPWHLFTAEGMILVTQVDSARALIQLRSAVPIHLDHPALFVVGGVEFGAGHPFQPLPGTVGAQHALEDLAQGRGLRVDALSGIGVTKRAVLKGLASATYADIATHGIFAAPPPLPSEEGVLLGQGTGAAAPTLRVPLVESGLALAGANGPSGLRPEGLLTAAEIVSLDCQGCDLVALSACNTGIGETPTGQGVLGMRSAFLAAGARSVLMTLWSVPDNAALLFSKAFYRYLWYDGLPKAEALRRAQREVEQDSSGNYTEPVFWAAWVLDGEGW